jgi:hypothetical protein
VAGSFMHVQMFVYGLSCCPFGHDIDADCVIIIVPSVSVTSVWYTRTALFPVNNP